MQRRHSIDSKKGVHEAVAIIMLMAITIAGIIAAYLIISPSFAIQSSPESTCLDVQLDPPVTLSRTCYNAEKNRLEVTASQKNHDAVVRQMNFFVYGLNGVQNANFVCGHAGCFSCSILEKGSSKTYYFPLSSFSGSVIPEELRSVELYVGSSVSCLSDSQDIIPC